MAPTPIEELRYILDCDSDATMMRRYNKATWGVFWMALEYLLADESLHNVKGRFLRQFLTLVYLSEVDAQ